MTGSVIERNPLSPFKMSRTHIAVALVVALTLVGHTAVNANGETESYLVMDGDTLTSIAAETGVPIERLVELNDLANPETILAGASLRLRGSAAQNQEGAGAIHEVQAGETVFGIARRYGVQPEDIIAANRLAAPEYIRHGDPLIIPRPIDASQPSVAGGGSVGVLATVPPIALHYRGAPYVFGGATPDGFDCSGFAYFVLNRAGIRIERDIWSQYESGVHPDRHQLLPGDLVFFRDTYGPGLSHNGIYLGNGEFVHAANEEAGVAVSNLAGSYWEAHWLGATRPNR